MIRMLFVHIDGRVKFNKLMLSQMFVLLYSFTSPSLSLSSSEECRARLQITIFIFFLSACRAHKIISVASIDDDMVEKNYVCFCIVL